jgi:hypothetical protein
MGNGMSLTAQSKPDLVEAGQQGADQWGESTVAPESQKDGKGARFAGGEVQELGRFLAKTCQPSGIATVSKILQKSNRLQIRHRSERNRPLHVGHDQNSITQTPAAPGNGVASS